MISPTRCSGSASRSPYRAGRSCSLDVMDLAGSAASLPGFGAGNEMEGVHRLSTPVTQTFKQVDTMQPLEGAGHLD